MTPVRHHEVQAPDGRTLAVRDHGPEDGAPIVAHHGTPGAGLLHRSELESADEQALRIVAYDRPGYGGSAPRRDRTVADAAGDVAVILDALGIGRFATYGGSGGGPHALACAALLGDRCAAAATIAGAGPADVPDLDWLGGMGDGNIAEFAAARAGRERLVEHCRADADQIAAATPEQLADVMRPHLSEVDARVLTGELAAFMLDAIRTALEPGLEGWVDDDYALLGRWGFDTADVRVPVLVWQGDQDLMVPPAHGRWLVEHLATAEGGVLPGEGHLTLGVTRIGELHAWLAERLR